MSVLLEDKTLFSYLRQIWDSLGSPSWPQTWDPPASVFWLWELQVWPTMPVLKALALKLFPKVPPLGNRSLCPIHHLCSKWRLPRAIPFPRRSRLLECGSLWLMLLVNDRKFSSILYQRVQKTLNRRQGIRSLKYLNRKVIWSHQYLKVTFFTWIHLILRLPVYFITDLPFWGHYQVSHPQLS